MTVDEMIEFAYDWISVFSGFGEYLMEPLGDIATSHGFWLPDFIGDHTLFGLMFGAGFTLVVAITLVKWALDIIN